MTKGQAILRVLSLPVFLIRLLWTLLSGYDRRIHASLFEADAPSLTPATLDRLVRELKYGEAKLFRAIHAAASRLAGVSPPRLTLAAYFQPAPRSPDTLLMRIVRYRHMLIHVRACIERLAARIRRALGRNPLDEIRAIFAQTGTIAPHTDAVAESALEFSG